MTKWAALLVLCAWTFAAPAAEVAGVKIPDTARVAGRDLVLNGAGLRSKAFIRIYAAGLYLTEKKNTPSAVLALEGPKRVTLAMLRDVTAQQLIDALNEGVRDNHPPAEVERLRPQSEALGTVMKGIGRAPNGAVVTLDFVPGAGTQIGVDGQPKGAPIPGDDFYRALLRIWLGDDPVDTGLKRALLGQGG